MVITKRRTLLIVLLLGVALISAACNSQRERPWLQPPAWSRGFLVGHTPFISRITFDLDDQLTAYFFYFAGPNPEESDLKVTAVGADGAILWEQVVQQNLDLPREPHIISDGQALQLFWISSETLFSMRMGYDGEVIRPPQQISGQYVASTMVAVVHPEAGLIVWFGGSRQNPGVYAYAPDDYYGRPNIIDDLGSRPNLMIDLEGVLHAAWAHNPTGYEERGIYYARYPELEYSAGQPVRVAALISGITSMLDGPWLGQSSDNLLVMWNLSVVTGLEAGKMTTEYVVIPSDGVEPGFEQRPGLLIVPSDYHETYRQQGTPIQAGERIWFDDVDGGFSAVIQHLSMADFGANELAIALEAKVDFLQHKQEFQIGVLFFQADHPTSFQLLTFDATASRLPNLVIDDQGYLYLSWIQSTDEQGNAIFFATTNPEVKAAISNFDSSDAASVVGDTLFGLVSGILISPIAILWLLVPLVVIGLTAPLRKEDEPIYAFGSLLAVALSLAAFWFAKYFSLQVLDMTNYVPFSAWIPQISGQTAQWLRILVPLLIFSVSIIFAWRQTYAKDNRSVMFFVIFYILLDSVLSVAIYGLLVYGAA